MRVHVVDGEFPAGDVVVHVGDRPIVTVSSTIPHVDSRNRPIKILFFVVGCCPEDVSPTSGNRGGIQAGSPARAWHRSADTPLPPEPAEVPGEGRSRVPVDCEHNARAVHVEPSSPSRRAVSFREWTAPLRRASGGSATTEGSIGGAQPEAVGRSQDGGWRMPEGQHEQGEKETQRGADHRGHITPWHFWRPRYGVRAERVPAHSRTPWHSTRRAEVVLHWL